MDTSHFKKYFTHKGRKNLLVYNVGTVYPPHEVEDDRYFMVLKKSMINSGWCGRPLLAHRIGRRIQLWTGSHRYRAAFLSNVPIPVFIIDLGNKKTEESIIDALAKIDKTKENLIDSMNELVNYDPYFFIRTLIPMLKNMEEHSIARIAAAEYNLP